MKSVLKHLLSNGIFIICILDILIVLHILYVESHIEYEPLMDIGNSNTDSNSIYLYPLPISIYNTMIMTLIVNFIVVLWYVFKGIKQHYFCNLICVIFYQNVICVAFSLGLILLKMTSHEIVISEDNVMFNHLSECPVWNIFKTVTETSIYTALFIVLYIATMYLLFRTIKISLRF